MDTLSFTIYESGTAVLTVPSTSCYSDSSGDDYYVGFTLHGSEIPDTFSATGNYTVKATATFGGSSKTSDEITVDVIGVTPTGHGLSAMAVEYGTEEPTDDVFAVFTQTDLTYNAASGYTYSAAVSSASITWTIDGVSSAPQPISAGTFTDDPYDNEAGTITHNIRFPGIPVPTEGENRSFVLTFTLHVTCTKEGAETEYVDVPVVTGAIDYPY